MFTNYDTKENCYKLLRSFDFLRTDDGKLFYHKDIDGYHFAYGEFAPCEYVVKYRKKINGEKKYGIYLRSFYYGNCRPDNAYRFLNAADIINLLIRDEASRSIFNTCRSKQEH